MHQINCKHGDYRIDPHVNTITLICPVCDASWHSQTSGVLWYTGMMTYAPLLPSFYPLIIDYSKLQPITSKLKRIVTKQQTDNLVFFDDLMTENETEHRKLSKRLELLTNGMFSSLPDSTTLFVDHSGLPMCPECYSGLLELLPY